MKKLTLAIVALALLAGAGFGFTKWKAMKAASDAAAAAAPAATEATAAPAVTVVMVATSDFVETANVSGSLVARDEILVSPEIDGNRVLELLVDEGSSVKKGQVLAHLASDTLEAQAAQNDASQARTVAAIARAKSQITETEARVKEANASLERAKPLKKDGYLSGATFDARESAASTAEAQLIAARDGVTSAEADKALVEAQRRELDWRRSRTEVKAPEDGIISRRNARVGAMATAVGEPMFRIIAKGEIELDAELIETEISKIKVGQKARVSIPGVGDIDGTVRLVSQEIDKTTRLGKVKISLGVNPALKLGAFARGTIETANSRGLAVPASSIQFDPKGSFVQIVVGDIVNKRAIKTGLVSNGLVEIKSGAGEGDTVVARAGTFLRDGDRIRPILLEKSATANKTAEAR